MRYACYCMTRNLYRMVIPSLKSLLAYNDIDKVYIIAEDDDIGVWLPENVEVINVSDQKWFRKGGPNYNTKYTYMALMRIALPFILPDVDRILYLDLDTICTQCVHELWELPMDGIYIAGCAEKFMSEKKGYEYINSGVLVMNLKKLRDGMASHLINMLNEEEYQYPDQDCMNEEIPKDNKKIIGSEYNFNMFNADTMCIPRIYHFAAYGPDRFKSQDIVCEWGEMPWERVLDK